MAMTCFPVPVGAIIASRGAAGGRPNVRYNGRDLVERHVVQVVLSALREIVRSKEMVTYASAVNHDHVYMLIRKSLQLLVSRTV